MERKKPTYYSEEFKTTVVNDVLLGKYTKEEARRLYILFQNPLFFLLTFFIDKKVSKKSRQ
jgi:hypothetical protein